MSECLLAMREASFRLGDRLVFANTNWSLGRGQQWAVVGSNGSGKSLFLEAARGALPVVQGEVSYHFRPPAGITREEAISLVCFEDRKLDVHQMVMQSRWNSIEEDESLRVRDFLSYHRVMEINPFEVTDRHLEAQKAFDRRVVRAVRLLRIGPLLDRLVISLSNGERQKLQLGRALSRPLRLLLLDEPFAGLDVMSREAFRETLDHLMASGLHVIVATTRPDDLPQSITHVMETRGMQVVSQRTKGPVKPPMRSQLASFLRLSNTSRKSATVLTTAPIVQLRKVSVNYDGVVILKDISWTIRDGEGWALVGRNGSGKTTLLGLITGDHPQMYINDVEVFGKKSGEGNSVREGKKSIGFVSPELHLHFDGDCSCFEVAVSGFFDSAGLFECPTPRQRRQASEWLARLELTFGAEPFCSRSLGEQRMVLIARAMVKEPRLLILDEPCQGLDLKHRRLVMRTVDEIRRRSRASVIYVTHRSDEIPSSIDRVFKLE